MPGAEVRRIDITGGSGSGKTTHDRNSPDLGSFNRACAAKSLEAYGNKLVVCRTNREIDGLVARLTASVVSLDEMY